MPGKAAVPTYSAWLADVQSKDRAQKASLHEMKQLSAAFLQLAERAILTIISVMFL